MKKKLSGIGILCMLILKHPHMPDYNILNKIDIVEVRTCTLQQVAVEFNIN